MPVKVKICGVRHADDARAVVAAGADLVGLNFCTTSPRFLAPDRAEEVAAAIEGALRVGVFVDAPRAQVEDLATRLRLDVLQFHGDEDPEYCAGWAWPVIKALRARPGVDLAALATRYATTWVLVDSHVPEVAGGTGVPLDPRRAAGIPAERLFAAGGLTPATVADVVRALRPFAVDVASGVEAEQGRKDHGKVEEFIRRAKAA